MKEEVDMLKWGERGRAKNGELSDLNETQKRISLGI